MTGSSLYSKAHRIAYLSLVFFFFTLSYPLLWYYGRKPMKHFNEIIKIRYWIAKYSTKFVGLEFKIELENPIDWSKNFVICANHSSDLDITAIMLAFDGPFIFIGKAELLKNPVTRFFFKRIDIPIDRNSKISSFKAYKKTKQELINGKSIAIFPEGGISNEFPPKLGEFKIGAFKLAFETKTSILPIVIHNTWKYYWDDGARLGTTPGKCQVTILSPVDSSKFSSAEELRLNVFENIKKRLVNTN